MSYLCFLDLDGVTHPVSANGAYFRAENMFPLIDCLHSQEILIVIASSWRLDMPLEEIKFMLGPLEHQVIGITPYMDDPFIHHPRQQEVELFLKQEGLDDIPWFAIDDNQAFYRADAPVIITDGRQGFIKGDCARLHDLIKSLNNECGK